jgi:hypothetical protein
VLARGARLIGHPPVLLSEGAETVGADRRRSATPGDCPQGQRDNDKDLGYSARDC